MLSQERRYILYKNIKRKRFSNAAHIRGKNRAKESSLFSSSESVPPASAFELEFCSWAQFLVEAFHWYFPLLGLGLRLVCDISFPVFLSHTDVRKPLRFNLQMWRKILIIFLTAVAWKALRPMRTIIKCTSINMFEVLNAVINKAL